MAQLKIKQVAQLEQNLDAITGITTVVESYSTNAKSGNTGIGLTYEARQLEGIKVHINGLELDKENYSWLNSGSVVTSSYVPAGSTLSFDSVGAGFELQSEDIIKFTYEYLAGGAITYTSSGSQSGAQGPQGPQGPAGVGISGDTLNITNINTDSINLNGTEVLGIDQFGQTFVDVDEMYIGANSLYVNGKKVITDESDTINITTDVDQNLTIKTSGGGILKIEADSQINIAGDVIVNSNKTISGTNAIEGLQLGKTKMRGDLFLPDQTKIYFHDSDSPIQSFIAANTDSPEDLEIHADQDLVLRPDGNVVIGSTPVFDMNGNWIGPSNQIESAGAQGNQGPQGSQGDRGAQGPQGFKGDQGPQGIQGDRGAQGNQGPEGPSGVTGSQGPTGNKGDQGDRGAQGNQGPTGDQGLKGDQGNQGPQGDQGGAGDRGAQGPQGPEGFVDPSDIVSLENAIAQISSGSQGSGPQGARGYQGFQGPQGSQGYVGPQGFKGMQGSIGFQGPQGFKGDQGNQGPQGTVDYSYIVSLETALQAEINSTDVDVASLNAALSSEIANIDSLEAALSDEVTATNADVASLEAAIANGSQGSGSQGPQGAQGYVGPQGARGYQGFFGPQGLNGLGSGDQGHQGFQGPQGPADGAQGAQGAKGDNGPTGPQGFQGSGGSGTTYSLSGGTPISSLSNINWTGSAVEFEFADGSMIRITNSSVQRFS